MPTIIDSLVLELELDPSKLSDGQRRALDSIQSLRRGAEQEGRQISSAIGESLLAYTAAIEAHTLESSKQLGVLASQGHRTGQAIAAGGKDAAAGIASITASALAAFAALKGLQGLYKDVTQTAAAAANTGRMIPEIGASGGWVQSFANAAKSRVNADPAAVMEDLRSLSVEMETWRKRGEMSQRLQEMIIGGVPLNQNDSVQDVMNKIGSNLSSMSPAEAAMRAQRYGISRDTGRFARLGPGGMNAAMAEQQARSMTDPQIQALDRLQQKENDVEIAYTHLWQTLTAKLSKDGLADALGGLAGLADTISQNETAMTVAEAGVVALATAITGSLVAAMIKLTWAVNSFWATPFISALTSGAFLRFLGPIGAAIGIMWPSAAGNQGEVDAEKGLFRRALKMNGREGDFKPTSSGGGGGGGGGISAGGWHSDLDEELTGDPKMDAALRLINSFEAKSGNVWNYKHNERPNYYTASGYWQMLRSNWHKYGSKLGIDFSKYPDAITAPKKMQAMVAAQMVKEEGTAPWNTAHGGSLTAGREAMIYAALSGANVTPEGKRPGDAAYASIPPAVDLSKYSVETQRAIKARGYDPSAMGNDYGFVEHGPGKGTAYWKGLQRMSAEEARRAAEGAAFIKNHPGTWMNGAVTTGDIHIHTQATDSDGIAKDMGDAIRRNVANQANTGLN